MRHRIAEEDPRLDALLPESRPDGSGIGVNHADGYVSRLRTTLSDGRKVSCKRRGLRLTLQVGERSGSGLMRRLDHGPDVRAVLRAALEEAARDAGFLFVVESGVIYLDEASR